MNNLLYKCMAKATSAEGTAPNLSINWALSYRGTLKIFDDHLECGKWNISYADISKATLFGPILGIITKGYVLKIETLTQTLNFGVNASKFWTTELPFQVSRIKPQGTIYPWIMRVIIIGLIGLTLFQIFDKYY